MPEKPSSDTMEVILTPGALHALKIRINELNSDRITAQMEMESDQQRPSASPGRKSSYTPSSLKPKKFTSSVPSPPPIALESIVVGKRCEAPSGSSSSAPRKTVLGLGNFQIPQGYNEICWNSVGSDYKEVIPLGIAAVGLSIVNFTLESLPSSTVGSFLKQCVHQWIVASAESGNFEQQMGLSLALRKEDLCGIYNTDILEGEDLVVVVVNSHDNNSISVFRYNYCADFIQELDELDSSASASFSGYRISQWDNNFSNCGGPHSEENIESSTASSAASASCAKIPKMCLCLLSSGAQSGKEADGGERMFCEMMNFALIPVHFRHNVTFKFPYKACLESKDTQKNFLQSFLENSEFFDARKSVFALSPVFANEEVARDSFTPSMIRPESSPDVSMGYILGQMMQNYETSRSSGFDVVEKSGGGGKKGGKKKGGASGAPPGKTKQDFLETLVKYSNGSGFTCIEAQHFIMASSKNRNGNDASSRNAPSFRYMENSRDQKGSKASDYVSVCFPLDCMAYVNIAEAHGQMCKASECCSVILGAAKRQFVQMYRLLCRQLVEYENFSNFVKPYIFKVGGIRSGDGYATSSVVYPPFATMLFHGAETRNDADLKTEAEQQTKASIERREVIHKRLYLRTNRPFLRSANSLCFEAIKSSGKGNLSIKILDIHNYAGTPEETSPGAAFNPMNSSSAPKVSTLCDPTLIKNATVAMVSGSYEYFHYMQDKFDDNGWGCAYRSLMTICSWLQFNGFTSKTPPSHNLIQETLVKLDDKPKNFVGSKQWIGSFEVSLALDSLYGISCKIMHVSTGSDLSSKGRELVQHFETQGTPVMIGGGVLAHTIIGVAHNPLTGSMRVLILDPHYQGRDEDPKAIVKNGWVGWKDPSYFFDQTATYNLCMPQCPSYV
eukprot:Nk52_evm2s305 gene=Nk52_evmTU2s305